MQTIEERIEQLEAQSAAVRADVDAIKAAPVAAGDGKDSGAREVLGRVLDAAGEIYTGAKDDRAKL